MAGFSLSAFNAELDDRMADIGWRSEHWEGVKYLSGDCNRPLYPEIHYYAGALVPRAPLRRKACCWPRSSPSQAALWVGSQNLGCATDRKESLSEVREANSEGGRELSEALEVNSKGYAEKLASRVANSEAREENWEALGEATAEFQDNSKVAEEFGKLGRQLLVWGRLRNEPAMARLRNRQPSRRGSGRGSSRGRGRGGAEREHHHCCCCYCHRRAGVVPLHAEQFVEVSRANIEGPALPAFGSVVFTLGKAGTLKELERTSLCSSRKSRKRRKRRHLQEGRIHPRKTLVMQIPCHLHQARPGPQGRRSWPTPLPPRQRRLQTLPSGRPCGRVFLRGKGGAQLWRRNLLRTSNPPVRSPVVANLTQLRSSSLFNAAYMVRVRLRSVFMLFLIYVQSFLVMVNVKASVSSSPM